MRWLVVAVLLLASGLEWSGQGVAVVGGKTRSSPLAKTDLPASEVRFEDIAAKAGLEFRHVSGEPAEKVFILETTGSGAAIFDFDSDGLYDIFLVNSTRWRLSKEETPPEMLL